MRIISMKNIIYALSYNTCAADIILVYNIIRENRITRYNRAFSTTLCDVRILIDSSARGNPIHQLVDS